MYITNPKTVESVKRNIYSLRTGKCATVLPRILKVKVNTATNSNQIPLTHPHYFTPIHPQPPSTPNPTIVRFSTSNPKNRTHSPPIPNHHSNPPSHPLSSKNQPSNPPFQQKHKKWPAMNHPKTPHSGF